MHVHLIFDLLAAGSAAAVTVWLARGPLAPSLTRVNSGGWAYYAALVCGAIWGAFALGTLNLVASGLPGLGRSILGAFLGAILAVEAVKTATGMRGSTGALFVPGFTISTMIGRWGCFLTGLEDQTHGIHTDFILGYDFGDGPRHPVQLYESGAMALALFLWVMLIARRPQFFRRYGFYLLCVYYGVERFVWEFLKPYDTVLGPLNVFHLGCLALIGYGIWMISRARTPA